MKINLKAENPISPSRTLGESYTKPHTSYFMTPEEHAAVIAKYGPPTMKLSDRRGHHYMEGKKGVKKDGDMGSKSKANGRRKNDEKRKVEGRSSSKVSGL